jgi:hypothetical protein
LEVLKVHTYITISTPLIPTLLQPNHSRIELLYQV